MKLPVSIKAFNSHSFSAILVILTNGVDNYNLSLVKSATAAAVVGVESLPVRSLDVVVVDVAFFLLSLKQSVLRCPLALQ